jgi:ankyrin repeat protein
MHQPAEAQGMHFQKPFNLWMLNLLVPYLDACADINAPPAHHNELTALQVAVEIHNIELVRLLVRRGANVNFRPDRNGRTILQEATYSGNATIVRILLNADADVNAAPPGKGMEVFQASLLPRRVTLFKMLPDLEPFDNPTRKQAWGTALQIAVARNRVDLVRLFVEKDVDISVPDNVAALAAVIAKKLINDELLETLMEAGMNVNTRIPANERTLLQVAAGWNDLRAVQMLLNAGADPNISFPQQQNATSLQEATARQNFDLVQVLVNAGADINAPAPTFGGRTALQSAALLGNMNLVRFLLSKGADVNATAAAFRGMTALQAAAIKGHLRIAFLLIQKGADVTAPPAEREGRTALDGAAEYGRLDMLQLLLNSLDETAALRLICEQAAEMAASNGHLAIAKFLREYRD